MKHIDTLGEVIILDRMPCRQDDFSNAMLPLAISFRLP